MAKLKNLARAVFFFCVGGCACAGMVNGPNVVWVNLDKSAAGRDIDAVVKNLVSNPQKDCGGRWFEGTSLLYAKTRPPLITDNLVSQVFIQQLNSQRKRLNFALKSYHDKMISDGFDGIIVYSSADGGKMMRLTTGEEKIAVFTFPGVAATPREEFVEKGFCALLPPITRRP